ncbi:MAG: hypothetical protein FWG79_08315 [Bacteroidales bacterium]|nr:hypothetical protein [Bacteroidales bacterium]
MKHEDVQEPDGNESTPPTENQSLESKYLALLDKYDVLAKELSAYKQEAMQRQILDELKTVARKLKIPEHIITHDLKHYISDFTIIDNKIVAVADSRQDAKAVLTALQKERIHWTTPTTVAGNEPMRSISMDDNHHPLIQRQTTHNNYDWFTN